MTSPWEDSNATPLIRIDKVTKRFGGVTALDGVTLDIYPGEFFALLGPSGCGKTTLLRLLGGFEEATGGHVHIDGRDMAGVPPNERAVNMMFQSYALFPHLTVAGNIAFGLKRSALTKSAIAARVDEMLRLVQLEDLAKRKPHQLSGGQRQRVALARALAKAPKLLLLDEPLGALDKKLRQQTQFELMNIQAKTNTTFVIVTHDKDEAMTMASRIAVMDNGRILQVDTPERIYQSPKSIAVASFIGDTNILEGICNWSDGESATFDWTSQSRDMTGIPGNALAVGERCRCVVRPEQVVITFDEPTDMPNRVQGIVEDIAYLGNVSTYHVRLNDGSVFTSQSMNRQPLSPDALGVNRSVWLSWPESAARILRP